MVTPQTLLAVGVGVPLLMIGVYTLWLGRRVARLEERGPPPDEAGEPDEASPEESGHRDSGNF